MSHIYQDPIIWGPSTWYVIHLLTFTYDKNLATDYQKFLHSLRYLIPCIYCKNSYNQILNQMPCDLSSKEKFIQWGINLHNRVNAKLRKPQRNLQNIMNHYLNPDGSIKVNNGIIFNFISLIVKTSLIREWQIINCQHLIMSLISIYPDLNKRNNFKNLKKFDKGIYWRSIKMGTMIVKGVLKKIIN